MTTVGDLIRTLRTEKDLTQKELATKVRIPRGTVSNIENGHSGLTTDRARKLLKFLMG